MQRGRRPPPRWGGPGQQLRNSTWLQKANLLFVHVVCRRVLVPVRLSRHPPLPARRYRTPCRTCYSRTAARCTGRPLRKRAICFKLNHTENLYSPSTTAVGIAVEAKSALSNGDVVPINEGLVDFNSSNTSENDAVQENTHAVIESTSTLPTIMSVSKLPESAQRLRWLMQ